MDFVPLSFFSGFPFVVLKQQRQSQYPIYRWAHESSASVTVTHQSEIVWKRVDLTRRQVLYLPAVVSGRMGGGGEKLSHPIKSKRMDYMELNVEL